jgi:hypothetical protein
MRAIRVAGALAVLVVLVSCGAPAAPVRAPAPIAVRDMPPLPDEGRRSTVAEFTDWITDPAPERAWLLDPCLPTAYPTDGQRVGFRTVSREGPEAFDARQLGVYPTA